MFLLLTSLMWLREPQRLIDVFIEAINSFSNDFNIEYCEDGSSNGSESICVCTNKMTFGYFIMEGDIQSPAPEFPALFQNAIQLLAVLLEKLYQDKILAHEKISLKTQVDQTSKSLQESEERYRLTMQAVNDGLFDFDVNSGEVVYSDRWYTMLGYEPGELPSSYETWKKLLPPEEAEDIERGLWDIIQSQERWGYEFKMLRKDCGWAWILARGQVVERDSENKPLRIVGTHTDITARKKAEFELKGYKDRLEELVEERTTELELLNERYDLALDATGIAVWEWCPKTDRTITNDFWFDIFGLNKEDAVNSYEVWVKNIHPDDVEWVDKSLKDHLEGKTAIYKVEYRYMHPKKGLVWLYVIGKVVGRDDNGVVTRVIGISSDITDRKNIERELNLKNEELAETLEQLKSTQSQLILFEKMAALRHLVAGIAHEINTPLGAISSSREIIYSNLTSSTESIPRLAQWLKGEFGDCVSSLIEKSLNLNVDNVLMSSRDRRKKRIELISMLDEAGVEAAEDIGHKLVEMRILSDIEPLVPMLKSDRGYDILCDISRVIDSIVACETIQTAVAKASKIVLALNNYIRREDNSVTGDDKKCFDIRMCIDNVLILFHNTIKNKVSLNVVYEEEMPEILGNTDELNQVWTNIIQNALQAMPEGGNLAIVANQENGGIVVKVTDDGCGMKPEVKAKIFEPLFTTKPAGEGTGLGLDIVRKIVVENHNGKIEVDSEYGKGTTVTVWLPRVKAETT